MALETRSGFQRTAAHRAAFTRFACSLTMERVAYRQAEDIARTARNLAYSEFGEASAYANDFRADRGGVVSLSGLRRATARTVNTNVIASIVEEGPKNPGPRPQGGRSGPGRHILRRAAQSMAISAVHGQA